MDLKENRSHSMISYSLYSSKRVFNKAERQQRTATVVGNTELHSSFPCSKEHCRLLKVQTSSTALERI